MSSTQHAAPPASGFASLELDERERDGRADGGLASD
jgi:hypothetical protein